MNAPIEFASDRRLQSIAVDAGFYDLPKALQEGLADMLAGAIEVIRKHLDDPERGDSGWRKQSIKFHLEHAYNHALQSLCAYDGNEVVLRSFLCDDDGLEHLSHAAARFALVHCVRRLLAEESEESK